MNFYEFLKLHKESPDSDPFKSIDEQLEGLENDMNKQDETKVEPTNETQPSNNGEEVISDVGKETTPSGEGEQGIGSSSDNGSDNSGDVDSNTSTGTSSGESGTEGQSTDNGSGEGNNGNGELGDGNGTIGENGDESTTTSDGEEDYFNNVQEDMIEGNTIDDLDPEVKKRAHLRINGEFKNLYGQYDTIYDKLISLDLKDDVKQKVDPILDEYAKLNYLLKTYISTTKDPVPLKIKRYTDIRVMFAIQNKHLALALGYDFMNHIKNNARKKPSKRRV